MKTQAEFLIETDILVEHLTQHDLSGPSVLELAMTQGICFTSVIAASELYFNCKDENQKEAVNSVLYAINVLGIHQRYCLNISEFFNKVASVRDALVCALAKNNKLPILTNDIERFRNSGIKVISPKELRG
ncbi:MAG: PIN domain-containing protein [Ignavibacteriales bacterium]|nr:PIN domain-containing protein [Ignavibacteriales bacterium]